MGAIIIKNLVYTEPNGRCSFQELKGLVDFLLINGPIATDIFSKSPLSINRVGVGNGSPRFGDSSSLIPVQRPSISVKEDAGTIVKDFDSFLFSKRVFATLHSLSEQRLGNIGAVASSNGRRLVRGALQVDITKKTKSKANTGRP